MKIIAKNLAYEAKVFIENKIIQKNKKKFSIPIVLPTNISSDKLY